MNRMCVSRMFFLMKRGVCVVGLICAQFWVNPKFGLFGLVPLVLGQFGQHAIQWTLVLQKSNLFFLKIPASFLFLFVFTTVNSKYVNFILKSCRWLDSNLGPLASEATVLTTEPQPLPKIKLLWCQVGRNVASGSRALLLLMRLSVSLARWSSRSQWSCKSSLMESFWPKSRFLSFELTSFFVNFNKW